MADTGKDVVIIGAGVIGASTAYFLTREAGFKGKVTIVEGTEIAAGASGKSGGFLAKDWHGAPTASLGRLSYSLHASLAAEHSGAERWGYRTLDTLSVQCGSPSSRKAASASKAPSWLDGSLVKATEVLGGKDSTAQVTPRLFTTSLVELAKEKGAEVVIGEAVGLVKEEGKVKAVKVKGDGGEREIRADEVVVAAGPWSQRVVEKLVGEKGRVRIEGSRAHSIILKSPALSAHALFVSNLPTKEGGHSEPEIYCRPDGTAYVCGASDDSPLPAFASLVEINPANIARLKRDCAVLSPEHLGEKAKVVAEQACYLPISRTGSPLVSKLEEGVWVAAGHAVWGVTLGPGTGKVLAELITGAKKTSADIKYLSA